MPIPGSSQDIPAEAKADQARTVTKAVIAAADRLGMTARILSQTIGVSEASISRMKRLDYLLEPATKPYELALFVIRIFRSLDAIVGGEEKVAQSWLRNPNSGLNGRPIERITSVAGLTDVLAYLDARRALI